MTQYIADLTTVCGCQWGVSGSSAEEIVTKTKKHAAEDHHMNEVPQEIAQKLSKAIRPSM
jgi:predicted small metal-binding protein